MRKGINIIQIKGTKGIIMAVGIGCCLFAGFIVFPGWVSMQTWNFISGYISDMPAIGIIQGVLLWGIGLASYYTFRKDKHVVYLRAPLEGLSEEELKEVFADIKKQAQDDPFLQSMIKARETELKIKELKEKGMFNSDTENDESEKIEIK